VCANQAARDAIDFLEAFRVVRDAVCLNCIDSVQR